MLLGGYRDEFSSWPAGTELVDASGWVDDPVFWPAYLLHVGSAGAAAEAFDADLADLDACLDEFGRADRWPVFAVPLGAGTMHVVVRNLPGDQDIDLVYDAMAGRALEEHAAGAGGYEVPGLPWALLPVNPAELLLGLPFFAPPGDGDRLTEAYAAVAAALRTVGAVALVEELAAELLVR